MLLYLFLRFLIFESLHPLGQLLPFLGSSSQLRLYPGLLLLVGLVLILPGSLDIIDTDILVSVTPDYHVFGRTVVAVYVLSGNHFGRAGRRGL